MLSSASGPGLRREGLLKLRLQRLTLLGGAFTAIAVVGVLFAELMLFGGDSPQVSLFFASVQLTALGLLVIFSPWARSALARQSMLQLPSLLFLLLLVWCFIQIMPLPWEPPANGWAHVPGRNVITIDIYASWVETMKLAGLGALTLIGVALGRDDDRAHVAWNTLGVLGGLYALWAVVEHLAPGSHPPGAMRGQLQASLGGPNAAATVLAIFAVIAWTAILRAAVSLPHRHGASIKSLQATLIGASPWVVLLLLSLGALSLTGSRGGAGACFCGLIASTLTMVWGERRNRASIWIILGATLLAVVCFVVLIVASGATSARLGRVDFILANRSEILSIYQSRLTEAPWTGFGLGAFRRFNLLLIAPGQNEVLWNLGAMHNVALQWIFEAGWPGAALMFAIVASLVVITLGGLQRRRFGRTWIAGSMAITTVVLTHGLVDISLQSPAIAGFWALALGVGAGVSRPAKRSSSASAD